MITLISVPNKFMAAHNFIPYTISSNKTTEPNFNFVIDVNQTGGASNPLARLVYPVQPSTNQLTFDIGVVLKNYVSYDLLNVVDGGESGTGVEPNLNSRVNYYCEFRELYDVSGIPTLSAVLVSDPTTPTSSDFKVASNAAFDFEDYGPLAFKNCDVSGFGFLNSQTIEGEQIDLTHYRTLSFFDPNHKVVSIGISANGIPPQTIPVTLTANEYIYNINSGSILFESVSGGTITPPTSIVIRLLASGSVILAQKVFTCPVVCSMYDNIRMHWLNKLGAFEAWNFNKVSRYNEDIERKQFKAPLQIGYSTADRLKTNYNTTIVDRISVNSDWITDEQSEYFEQLMTSPVIYLERSATDFVAVNITNVQYERKKFINDRRMFNISFDIEYTYNRYRQSI